MKKNYKLDVKELNIKRANDYLDGFELKMHNSKVSCHFKIDDNNEEGYYFQIMSIRKPEQLNLPSVRHYSLKGKVGVNEMLISESTLKALLIIGDAMLNKKYNQDE